MAMVTIRPMTDEDAKRIREAAARFVQRHQLSGYNLDGPEEAIHCAIATRDDGKELERLWIAAFRRAVKEPGADTYGYGYIGKYVK